MIAAGSVVIVHLTNPPEQFWGVLEDLVPAGVTFRGLNVASFEDFLAQAAGNEERTLGFSTVFVPLFRVERIYLDQKVGAVESYTERFERRVGRSLELYVGADLPRLSEGEETPPS